MHSAGFLEGRSLHFSFFFIKLTNFRLANTSYNELKLNSVNIYRGRLKKFDKPRRLMKC